MVGINITWTTVENMGGFWLRDDFFRNKFNLGMIMDGIKRAIQDIATRSRPICVMLSSMDSYVRPLTQSPATIRMLWL